MSESNTGRGELGDRLVEMTDINKTFKTSRWPARPVYTKAIDNVTLNINKGESVGIAGESGSGKSTLVSALCGLVTPDSGTITFQGEQVFKGKKYDKRTWKHVQLVFQDPYTSLNPAMRIVDSVAEPARLWHKESATQARDTAMEILEQVGLGGVLATRRPAALSGGQRQRASIARALAARPELLVLDESVSALDVSIQAQILELLFQLRRERHLTYILVSHDISVIRLVCDRVVVMQNGAVVEEATSAELTPEGVKQDYTRALLEAVPVLAI